MEPGSQAYSQGVHLTNVYLDYSNTQVLATAGGKFPADAQPITGVETPDPLRYGAAYMADYCTPGLMLTTIRLTFYHLRRLWGPLSFLLSTPADRRVPTKV